MGAGTTVLMMPDIQTGIVVLTNGGPVGVAEATATEFFDLVNFGDVTRDWYPAFNGMVMGLHSPVGDLAGQDPPQDPAPARAAEALIGTYQNDYFGPARVEAQADGLVLYLGPDDMVFPLQHWTGDTFATAPRSENAPLGSLSSVTFADGTDQAETLHIDMFDKNGLGTWRRMPVDG